MIHSKMLTDDSGHIEHDPKANKLTKAFVDAKVGPRAIDTIMNTFQQDESRFNAYMPKALELNSLSQNDSKFRQHLACLTVNEEEDMDEDMEKNVHTNDTNDTNDEQ